MSNENNNFFLKKMRLPEFMDIFPYVNLNWNQNQEGPCKPKLNKIQYTCI